MLLPAIDQPRSLYLEQITRHPEIWYKIETLVHTLGWNFQEGWGETNLAFIRRQCTFLHQEHRRLSQTLRRINRVCFAILGFGFLTAAALAKTEASLFGAEGILFAGGFIGLGLAIYNLVDYQVCRQRKRTYCCLTASALALIFERLSRPIAPPPSPQGRESPPLAREDEKKEAISLEILIRSAER